MPKQSVAVRVPVRLLNTDGTAKTGVAAGSVTCTLQKQASSSATKTIDGTNWFEIDATNMAGWYDILLSSSDTDTLAWLKYHVKVSGADDFPGLIYIKANESADVYGRLGAPAGASVSADVAAVKGDTAAVKLKTDNLPADPADASDIAASFTSLTTLLNRLLGLSHENAVLDQPTYSGANLTAARLRTYDSKANADAAGATGLVATYAVTATYSAGNLATYKMTKEA